MTPEERAVLLRKNLALPAYEDELIAIYIRAAENDALERAVAAVERECADWEANCDGDWAIHLPTVIRSAKHAEPTS